MKNTFNEAWNMLEHIDQQPDIEYKGWTIRHFPVTWDFGDSKTDIDGYIILSKYYLDSAGNERHFLPLYCENEEGKEINFKTSE